MSKIQDEAEAARWIEEGKTYAWIVEEYRRKYNIETSLSMWAAFRRRKGIAPRVVRNDDLIPWAVELEHRWLYPLDMLRIEARRRAGLELPEDDLRRLESFKAKLAKDDLVVHYDPETERGFFYVPRRPDVDRDLIREPSLKTTRRRARGD